MSPHFTGCTLTIVTIDFAPGNPLVCDCEMRWYRKWYNDGWQEVDEDHIRDTDCTDPYDGKEHNIAQVSTETLVRQSLNSFL